MLYIGFDECITFIHSQYI